MPFLNGAQIREHFIEEIVSYGESRVLPFVNIAPTFSLKYVRELSKGN